MADVYVYTNKIKEAIYEYTTSRKNRNLSLETNVGINLFYNRGNRLVKITIDGQETPISLMGPKKPDGTPTRRKPGKSEVRIKTDKVKEAIYEYSTNRTLLNLSIEPSAEVYLFYNGGNRRIQVKKGRMNKTVALSPPKKPDSTPFRVKKKK